MQEKVVASAAKTFILVADDLKLSSRIGLYIAAHARHVHILTFSHSHIVTGTVWQKGIPVEIVPFALEHVLRRLTAMGGTPTVRTSTAKMGPAISGQTRAVSRWISKVAEFIM